MLLFIFCIMFSLMMLAIAFHFYTRISKLYKKILFKSMNPRKEYQTKYSKEQNSKSVYGGRVNDISLVILN